MGSSVKEQKQQLREYIWALMESSGVAKFPLPCKGRIPNFIGAEAAADKLRQLPEWKEAKVVFVCPDSPQQKVRENALLDDKILVMASPRLKHGFILVLPHHVKGKERLASTIRGAFKFGTPTINIPKPEIIVEGSVAVDLQGRRLGKGHGYGDFEILFLRRRFGYIPVATTVHDLQVVENVPSGKTDQNVSIIVTPTRVIRVKH
ncbi:MAG: 5-formyltetrahydrofolate cyclo-ligase [Candidatus Bathyarchaeia archaeon]